MYILRFGQMPIYADLPVNFEHLNINLVHLKKVDILF